MPIVKYNKRYGQCPYCYAGDLAYDKYSDSIYCRVCNSIVSIHAWKDVTILRSRTKDKFIEG